MHRDVKPENVLLDAATGRAMLTDFGVARAFASGNDSDDDSAVTRTGFVVGSPRYMSPEQAVGERELDGRSDIYSLGLVAYEMFAGSAPFTGSSPMAVLTKQLTEAPPPLVQRRPDLPAEITETIDRALSKQPRDRWPTARGVRARHHGCVAPRTRRSPCPSCRRPATPAARVSTVVTPAAEIACAARAVAPARAPPPLSSCSSCAGVTLWLRQGGTPSGVDPRKSFLVAPFEILGGGDQLAWLREGSASMLTLDLSQWSDLNVVSYERGLDLLREAKLDTARRIGLADARAMARRAGVWTVVMGQVTAAGDSLLVTARLFDVATGRQVHQAQQAGARTTDPRPLFDALTRQLLDVVGAPASISLGRLTETTTESVEAYRAYLEGTRAMNRWRLDRADSLFALATARDSNFALAYYHRAMVLGWRQVGDSLHLKLAARAASLANRLPPQGAGARRRVRRSHARPDERGRQRHDHGAREVCVGPGALPRRDRARLERRRGMVRTRRRLLASQARRLGSPRDGAELDACAARLRAHPRPGFDLLPRLRAQDRHLSAGRGTDVQRHARGRFAAHRRFGVDAASAGRRRSSRRRSTPPTSSRCATRARGSPPRRRRRRICSSR